MKVGIIAAGRIGKVHAKNITYFVPELEIKTVADPFMNPETEALLHGYGHSEYHKGCRRDHQRS